MKTWKLALLIGGLSAVAVFFAGAIAFGAAGNDRGWRPGGMMVAGGDAQRGDGPGQGCGRSALLEDPQAREDLAKLREEHRAEMRAWWDKYGDDSASDAARTALDGLRADHADEMRALLEKYGVEAPDGLGRGGTPGCGPAGGCGGQGPGGGCGGEGRGGGMMGDPGSWGQTSL
jgi:hypothetical protein